MDSELFQRRFVIVSGKGGVGKSTICMALAVAAARTGRRTCIVQLNTRDAVGRFFGKAPIGYEPQRLDDELPLWACNLRPREALREYGLMKLRFRALHRLVFENEMMRRVLGMTPGMTETLLLGKAWFMEEEELDDAGQRRWDLLVVDAPSTGHGVALFRLPEVILGAVPVGPMADDAHRMHAMLADPERTAFNIATLPLELPVNEALDLERQAREVIGVPAGFMFANMVLPPVVPPAFRGRLVELSTHADPLVAAAAANAGTFSRWRAAQQVQMGRLRAGSMLPVVELPHHLAPMDRAAIDGLADLVATLGRSEQRASA